MRKAPAIIKIVAVNQSLSFYMNLLQFKIQYKLRPNETNNPRLLWQHSFESLKNLRFTKKVFKVNFDFCEDTGAYLTWYKWPESATVWLNIILINFYSNTDLQVHY